ncbi:thioredoxin-like protein [Daedaleopsis nitida]|nr:thioredoxin-like protein [Daedaleopsis nitida]
MRTVATAWSCLRTSCSQARTLHKPALSPPLISLSQPHRHLSHPAITFRLPAATSTASTPSPSLSHRRTFSSSRPAMSDSSFYSLKATLPGNKTYDFEQLKGKVVLIVNTASKCGFTPQYKGIEALHKKYKDQGLVVLGFPCNQFGGQEPENDEKIAEFCELNHGVSFPLMAKSDVNGDNTNEVFKWLKGQKAGILGLTRIKWNFEKFLVDKEGKVVNRWASTTSPEDIDATIKKLL